MRKTEGEEGWNYTDRGLNPPHRDQTLSAKGLPPHLSRRYTDRCLTCGEGASGMTISGTLDIRFLG